MAVDAFLKLDGIPGESRMRSGEIDLKSFSWGVTGAAAGAGQAVFQSFIFTAVLGKQSQALFKACDTGKIIKSAILTLNRAGAMGKETLQITFSQVLITGYKEMSLNGDVVPSEQVSFNFFQIQFGDFTTSPPA